MKALVFRAEWAPRDPSDQVGCDLPGMRARMASRVLRNPSFALEEVVDPKPGHGQVVVRVRRCGVCGSDTHLRETDTDGYVRFSGPTRCSCILGHEYSGEVVALGPGVRHLRVGELVAGEGMLACGACEACRRGMPNQCPHLDMLGFSAPGAFADFVVSDERFLWSLDPLAERLGDATRALELGALVEPVACSYNGMFVKAGGFLPGSHVAIFGAGPIGLGAVALARAAGAATITVFETVAARCEVARALGADVVEDPRAVDPVAVLRATTRGWGADMIVEAAGAALETLPVIEQSFAPGGKMVYLGRTGLRAPVMLDTLVTLAAGIHGARGHSGGGCFPGILRLMEAGRLPLSPMITARVPFPRVIEALEQSCSRQDAKILVTMGD